MPIDPAFDKNYKKVDAILQLHLLMYYSQVKIFVFHLIQVAKYLFSYHEQSLLKSHEKVENEIRTFCSEVDRVKELSRKVIKGASSLAFVSFSCYILFCILQYISLPSPS